MKKLLLLLLLAPLLWGCSSDDDEYGQYEFYIISTENIPCIEAAIREEYKDEPEYAEERIKDVIGPIKSFMTLTDKGAKEGAREMEKQAALAAPNCPPIKCGYRKVE